MNGLIAAALKAEWSFLKNHFSLRHHPEIQTVHVFTDHPELWLWQTGVGPDLPLGVFEKILAAHKPQRLLNIGTCGALELNLKCGDLVVSTAIAAVNSPTVKLDSYPSLSRKLEAAKIPFIQATTLSATESLKTSLEKKSAHENFGAVSVDMEGFTLAGWCDRHGMKFCNVRGVFDEACEDLVSMGRTHHDNGDFNTTGLVADLVNSPSLILRLPGLQKKISLIQKRLLPVVHWFVTDFK